MILFENNLRSLIKWTKNGFYVHIVHALLQVTTGNTYLSATLAIKLYSLNYFYWYGHLYTYLPRHNWVKQFIRMTDTGHIASFALLIGPLFMKEFVQRFLPIAHNVHFIIFAAYWIAKGVLGMKDADRLVAHDLVEWHMDLLTYVHHTVPYLLLHLFPVSRDCAHDYGSAALLYTYGWIYAWFLGIYCPWRFFTGDTVYSILDTKNTSRVVLVGFLCFMHVLVWVSNTTGYAVCLLRSQ